MPRFDNPRVCDGDIRLPEFAKQVIVVANLKPAKLMGILSNGMLLAAVDGSECTVATLDKKVKPGIPLT